MTAIAPFLTQRKLTIMRIERLLSEICPCLGSKAVSHIMYNEGFTAEKVEEYLKMLKTNDIIETELCDLGRDVMISYKGKIDKEGGI